MRDGTTAIKGSTFADDLRGDLNAPPVAATACGVLQEIQMSVSSV